MSKEEICYIINTFGDNTHPEANLTTLEYFKQSYIEECIRRKNG